MIANKDEPTRLCTKIVRADLGIEMRNVVYNHRIGRDAIALAGRALRIKQYWQDRYPAIDVWLEPDPGLRDPRTGRQDSGTLVIRSNMVNGLPPRAKSLPPQQSTESRAPSVAQDTAPLQGVSSLNSPGAPVPCAAGETLIDEKASRA